jgi:hypothetical protein
VGSRLRGRRGLGILCNLQARIMAPKEAGRILYSFNCTLIRV